MEGTGANKKSKIDNNTTSRIENENDDNNNNTVVRDAHRVRSAHVSSIVSKVINSTTLLKAPTIEDNTLLLQKSQNVLDLFDFDTFDARLAECQEAFSAHLSNGSTVMNALAVKANPVRGILSRGRDAGFGAECASFPEAIHSLSLNFKPRTVIYDTPCKPLDELVIMIDKGCYLNLDNLDEVEKVNMILKSKGHTGGEATYAKQFGVRLNPVVGGGSIASTSTATEASKFGLQLTDETKETLFKLYGENEWLQGVHVHIGSQGCALKMLVTGAKRAVDFALETNARLGRFQIQVMDIGGGLPTLYDGVNEAYSYKDYVTELNAQVPELFSSGFTILTEFGRSMFVKSGITLSRVETVKTWCNQRIAVVHIGANQFLRTAYLPNQWKHSFSVFDSNGKPKDDAPLLVHDIAGPMCFSGDFLAQGILLPEIEAGDILVIHDTGGYTVSMYSKYNSRRASAIYAYEGSDQTLSVLKTRETCEETLAFWGLEKPTPI